MEDGRSLAGQDIVCTGKPYKRPARSANGERPDKAGRLAERFEMRCSGEDRAEWQSHADSCGLILSEWLRATANNAAGIVKRPRRKKQISHDDAVAYALMKIGTNINQQTHAMNTAARMGAAPDPRLAESIGRTHAELSALLDKLAAEAEH